FELFMPDRPDLRFLGVPMASVPRDTSEGDYFSVFSTALLEDPSFAVHLHVSEEYPVIWAVEKMEKMEWEGASEGSQLVYIMKKKAMTIGGES
ncbi:hypothetical protein PMAYCL1PPCAC_19586, partial [Pristionchus mayeri]